MSLQCGDVWAFVKAATFLALEELDLSKNLIGAEGAAAIANASCFSTLRRLNLSKNRLSDAGGKAIAQSTVLAKLDFLDLYWNGLTSDGISAIAQSTCFTTLKSLDLGKSRIVSLFKCARCCSHVTGALFLTLVPLDAKPLKSEMCSPSSVFSVC